MFNFNNDINIKENVSFICSIKNCRKNYFYKMKIINEEGTLGDFSSLETEELYNKNQKSEINFKPLKGIEFRFSQRQLYKIQIQKRKENDNFYETCERITVLSSLVSSPGSLYERKVDENDDYSEIFSIKMELDKNKNIFFSENFEFFDVSEFFQKGGKLKLFFLFDFSHKNDINEYNHSQNIFYHLLVNFYNYCQIYTANHEVNLFGAGVKPNSKSDFDSDNDSDFIDLKTHFDYFMIDSFKRAEECFLNSLNEKFEENQLLINSFIENCDDMIENKFLNVLFIFLRYSPDDLNLALDKINEIKNKRNPLSIIIINVGESFSSYSINKIEQCSSVIYLEIKDKSQIQLNNIVQRSLNHIGNNINEFKNYIKFDEEIIGENYNNGEDSVDMNEYEQENNEENEEDEKKDDKHINKKYILNSSNINNNSLNNNHDFIGEKEDSINQEKKNNKNSKILRTSLTEIKNSDNSTSKIKSKNPYMLNAKKEITEIKESNNESDSGMSKNDKELNNSNRKLFESTHSIFESEIKYSNQNINNDKDKEQKSQDKVIDSNAKTDFTSFNNKVVPTSDYNENCE